MSAFCCTSSLSPGLSLSLKLHRHVKRQETEGKGTCTFVPHFREARDETDKDGQDSGWCDALLWLLTFQ